METNDDCLRKRSLGFLPIPAESGRMESPSLSFPLCLASFLVSLIYVLPCEVQRRIYWGYSLKPSWIFKHAIRCMCYFLQITLSAGSVMGCAIAEGLQGYGMNTDRVMPWQASGRARGTRVKEQARWSQRAESRFGSSSAWAGKGEEDQWSSALPLQDRTVHWLLS